MLSTLLFTLLSTFLYAAVSGHNNEEALKEQEKLQEDSQDFTHEENIELAERQQRYHQENLLNDPLLSLQGLTSVGMSQAGAIQALVGAPSTGYSPTATNGSSPISSVPNMNAGFQPFADLGDIMKKMQDIKESESRIDVNESTVIYNRQMVDESKKRMDKIANDMNIDNQQLEIAKMVADSQVDVNASQVRVNNASLKRIASEVTLNMAKVQNLDADTALKYVEASKVIAETQYIQAETGLAVAQTGYVQSQTVGQNISNLDADIVLQMKQFRLEISQAIGCDVDAPEATQILEAMTLGRWDTVDKLLEVSLETEKGSLGLITRFAGHRAYKPSGNRYWRRDEPSYKFTPSFQSDWNPQKKRTDWHTR